MVKTTKKIISTLTAGLITFSLTVKVEAETALATYCSQEAVTYSNSNNSKNNVPIITSIHVAETGLLVGACMWLGNAMLAIYEGGEIELVQREAGANINYYNSGKIQNIGNLAFDYYPNSGNRAGKIRLIGNLYFDYYPNNGSSRSDKLRSVGNLYFDYYPNGDNNSGKIQRIGDVNFQYLSNGIMESQGQISGVKIVIR